MVPENKCELSEKKLEIKASKKSYERYGIAIKKLRAEITGLKEQLTSTKLSRQT